MIQALPRFCLALLCLTLLSACGSNPATVTTAAPLIPLPPKPRDPDNAALARDVRAVLQTMGAPAHSRYDFSRTDLNGDKRRDAFVLLKTPYGYWCGMHGCTMLVMRAHDDHFTLVNAIQPIRTPFHVDETKTQGWKDLIVRVSGRWQDSKDVTMRFNGISYPSTPANLPHDASEAALERAARVFP